MMRNIAVLARLSDKTFDAGLAVLRRASMQTITVAGGCFGAVESDS
jgi:hypothetical protein